MNPQPLQVPNVIFDFDGPVCSVFAGLPAPIIANQLRTLAKHHGTPVADIETENDPLEILRWAGRQDDELLTQVEDALIAAETLAVATAEPTPGAHALMRAIQQRKQTVGIASNNASEAIVKYLVLHNLAATVSAVSGRLKYAPSMMKPNDHCLQKCMQELSAKPSECVFIGDSLTDITAARLAGIPVIAYANKPGKAEAFAAAGAEFVITNLAELA